MSRLEKRVDALEKKTAPPETIRVELVSYTGHSEAEREAFVEAERVRLGLEEHDMLICLSGPT